jgi:hypothetical protein
MFNIFFQCKIKHFFILGTISNQNNKSPSSSRPPIGSNSFVHPFLFIIFASALLLVFIALMIKFIYGIINNGCTKWVRKRSSHRKKGRKTRNVIRDESTVIRARASDAV